MLSGHDQSETGKLWHFDLANVGSCSAAAHTETLRLKLVLWLNLTELSGEREHKPIRTETQSSDRFNDSSLSLQF